MNTTVTNLGEQRTYYSCYVDPGKGIERNFYNSSMAKEDDQVGQLAFGDHATYKTSMLKLIKSKHKKAVQKCVQ